MKPIDKTAKMCIIAASGAERIRVAIPFSLRAFITEYNKRNDNAGAVCPAGSLRFFA